MTTNAAIKINAYVTICHCAYITANLTLYLQVVLSASCHSTQPFVRDLAVEKISLEKIEIKENLLGLVSINLKDLTENVEQVLFRNLQSYLSTESFIPWGGEILPLSEVINKILLLNCHNGANFNCPTPEPSF